MSYACGNGVGQAYPYGDQHLDGVCNDASEESLSIVATGFLASCVNDQGVFDLIGNVNEWTADEGAATGTHQSFGGGYLTDPSVSCIGETSTEDFLDSTRLPDLGFRCCL